MREGLGILLQVFVVGLENDDAAGLRVAEKADSPVHGLLEVAEADDVAVALHGVEDTVGAAEGLDQAVHLKVLIDP